ncbi:WD40 repeat domain-containing protein [Streptomyces specialis]|uniref:WD40 repeat domain-containing protein n=1 Tax=Streptomyces specialis TaxID=498367 RepID=UPI00099E2551|nr:WD40 repeat domain-containing protein [Streptomyces specialis]
MAERTGYAVPTLSRAAAGENLPSLAVTLAYVEACGGDRDAWEQRWPRAVRDAATDAAGGGAPAPYQGLARFEPGDRDRFFGRDQLAADLLGLVRAHRFTAVFGPSGSGKSSLLRAGLIPALQTSRDPAERAEFIDRLLAARKPGSRLRVVIAVRADFYARCAEHPELPAALNDASLLVGPMSPAELRQAIVKPARAAGLIVERALTARLVEEVAGEPGGLPLLSHALLETWRRRRGRTLTLAGYEATGGVRGAVARTAEHTYTRLGTEQAALARRILLRLITPGEGTPDTRRPTDRSELAFAEGPDTDLVLEHLARARLITLDDTSGDLAHEALITAWPRLRSWIETDRERLRVPRRLTQDAHAWQDLGRDPGALYRGHRLATAEETFPTGRHDELTALEREFLSESRQARDREQRAAARVTRRLRVLTATLSLLLVMATTAAGWAILQQHTATTAQQVARSRQLASESAALLETDPDLASLLAVQAYRASPTSEALTSLYAVAALPLRHRLTGHNGPVEAAVHSPDGRTLVTIADNDGTVRLWDPATGVLQGSFDGHFDGVSAVAFTPDGHRLTTVHPDGTVRAWDLSTGRTAESGDRTPTEIPTGVRTETRGIATAAFAPDGRTLATATDDDGTVRLWDTATGDRLLTLKSTGPVETLVFSPGGDTLAIVGGGDTATLWNTATGEPGLTFGAASALAFSPDGDTVATGTGDGTVRLWDSASGERLRTLVGEAPVSALAFSPDGATLATAAAGTVRLSDTATGRAGDTLTGHTGAVRALAFSPDGRSLASASVDATVRLWNATTRRTTTLTGHTGRVNAVLFAPDGESLATAGADGTVRIWDPATGRARILPTSHTGGVAAVAFGPGGDTLATAGGDGAVRIWDATTGQRRAAHPDVGRGTDLAPVVFAPDGRLVIIAMQPQVRLRDTTTGRTVANVFATRSVTAVAFSPDGDTFAMAGTDGTVQIADVATGGTLTTLSGHSGAVDAVTFSPDGDTVVTAGADGTVRIWDTATGDEQPALTGRTSGVNALAFSPDGDTLATASADGTVRIWDLATGRVRTTLTGETGDADAMAFSPDGTTLATAGADGVLRLWDVTLPGPEEAVRAICETLDRDLTRQERDTYLTDGSETPTCPAEQP